MLLRLVPSSPLPTILFTLQFPNLPETIPCPPNWILQLQQLAYDDFEVPSVVHVLDKSTWLIPLLEQVTFDLTCSTITCLFVDGTTEEWPLLQHKCIRALECVLSDVKQSSLEDALDKKNVAVVSSLPLSHPSGKPPKHKKSRSRLMSIVATLVPSISLSSPIKDFISGPPSPSISQIPQSAIPASPTKPNIFIRDLRRRARSGLVDAYRCFVAAELSKRMKPGGYYTWLAGSMLQRQQTRMRSIIQRAGGIVPEIDFNHHLMSGIVTSCHCPHPSRQSFSYCDEDGEDESIADTTDTDGSSVHTPTDLPMDIPQLPRFGHYYRTDLPRTPSPPQLAREDIQLYASLNRQCMRLRQILLRMEAFHAHLENEEQHACSILEIKSRRRAWSNRQLVGGSPLVYAGLATPFRSSPLAIFEPITSEDWIQNDMTSSFESLSICTGDHDLSELFPDVEEEYDDPVYESRLEGDLEMGFYKPTRGGYAAAPSLSLKYRSTRTPNPLDLENDFSPPPAPPVQYKDICGQRDVIYDPKFTLNMDLPPSYKFTEDTPFEQGWISPSGVVVGCR